MYTTDREGPPKRPVVTSLAGALTEVRHWLRENQLDQVRDGDGQAWALSVKVGQEADPSDPRGLRWELRIGLEARVDGAGLVETATLDRVKDERLLQLIGSQTIDLKMRPLIYKAPSEEAAKSLLVDVLPKLKASFGRSTLTEVKRALVGRFVDESCRFSGGPA